MTAITLEHISKRYPINDLGDTIVAVDDISMHIPEGQTLALVGPSGCGKTTLLRLMAGLEKPDTGRVLYDQTPLTQIEGRDRHIGMVFQSWALIPQWKSRRTIGFFLRLRKREDEVPERVRQVSKITGVGIEHLMERYPRQLSGGEKQRVAIARAFARDLAILLFDEPFANLDVKLRNNARLEIRRLLDQFPVTSVMVTHDQVEAISLAERIAVMREGHIEQFGTFDQLCDSPVNHFVASFMGTPPMTFFEGVVHEGYWYGETFEEIPTRRDWPSGSRVKLGVRPQHIHLVPEGVPGVVDAITPYYAERYQLLDVWLAKERWQVQVPLDHPVRLGETIYCEIDPQQVYYFDARTGQRIG